MGTHVILVAFPFGSHPAALFALARALATVAPATIFSFIGTAHSLAYLTAPAAALGNVRLCPVPDGLPSPPPANIEQRIGLFLRSAPANLRQTIAEASAAAGVAVNCIVSDSFMWTVRELAEEMAVPWVALWPGGTASLSAHLHTDLLRKTIGSDEQTLAAKTNETIPFVPGLSAMRVRDLPEGVVTGDLNSGFPALLHGMSKVLPSATAVVMNTIEGLDPEIDAYFKAAFKEYLPVGPTNLLTASPTSEDAECCLPWLDQQSGLSVAYISFGMIMSLPPAELAALAEALEESGIPFLWSLKVQLRDQLPAGFIDRMEKEGKGLVVAWAPQVRVLEHPAVGAFVTHCGWNSVMESISTGAPMVCRPLFGDHMMAERMVSKVLGIGVGFEGGVVTKEAALSALKLVLEEEGKKIKERISKLKIMAIEAVGPEGSSTKNLSRVLEILCRKMRMI